MDDPIVGYRVTLGSGRFAEHTMKTLAYGRKPKWLKGGWVHEEWYGFHILYLNGLTAWAYIHEYNQLTVMGPRDDPERALPIAENLAGKLGTVRPLTQKDLDREYAEEYERLNG